MKKEELVLERECRRVARQHGWVAVKLEKNGHKGIPDDIFLHEDGRFFLVEFKKDERQKPRPEQEVWLQRFSRCSFLVGSLQTFENIFQGMKNNLQHIEN